MIELYLPFYSTKRGISRSWKWLELFFPRLSICLHSLRYCVLASFPTLEKWAGCKLLMTGTVFFGVAF